MSQRLSRIAPSILSADALLKKSSLNVLPETANASLPTKQHYQWRRSKVYGPAKWDFLLSSCQCMTAIRRSY
jgi:hypothetical protein